MVIKNYRKRVESHFQQVMKTKRHPHSIALGVAIGSFISILPTPGFNVIIGILIVLIFPRISKYALFFAFVIWNPFTAIPVYWLSLKIGNLIFAGMPVVDVPLTVYGQVLHYTRRFLVGNVIVAIFFSALSYALIKQAVILHYKKQGHSRKEISQMLL